MKKVVSVGLMRKSDLYTIQSGIAAQELMRRAGEAIFEYLPSLGSYAVVCGPGNNGGDGFVVALSLSKAGKRVKVFLISKITSPVAQYYFDMCTDCNIEVADYVTGSLCGYDCIVDCMLGTGFHGKLTGAFSDAADEINASGAYVVSADINSGLDGDSGTCDKCVISDLTVAVGYAMAGNYLGEAKDAAKRLEIADIGINLAGEPYMLCEAEDFSSVFPARRRNSHKGTFGTAAVFGGCIEYSGAVKLANLSLSALIGGCGVSRLITDKDCAFAVVPYLLESTLFPLDGINNLDAALRGVCSLAVGMGFGRDSGRVDLIEKIICGYDIPTVIDADGLYALSQLPDIKLRKNIVITPHPAEFSRLYGLSVADILSDPVKAARGYAKEHGITVLLKGASTVVTDGERVFIVDRGAPGMATAGSGDVLSGVICGINAQNHADLTLNAACGAWVTGVSGELAQNEKNEVSMTSHDTVRHLHEAISLILK